MNGFQKDFLAKFPMGAAVTVTAEKDGTFFVRIGGNPFTRWPNREIAERRAEHVRRFDRAQAA